MLKQRFYFADDAAPIQPKPVKDDADHSVVPAYRMERVLKSARHFLSDDFTASN